MCKQTPKLRVHQGLYFGLSPAGRTRPTSPKGHLAVDDGSCSPLGESSQGPPRQASQGHATLLRVNRLQPRHASPSQPAVRPGRKSGAGAERSSAASPPRLSAARRRLGLGSRARPRRLPLRAESVIWLLPDEGRAREEEAAPDGSGPGRALPAAAAVCRRGGGGGNSKALECKNQGGKTKLKGYGGLKEKTLECGQIVWGLAFSSWLPSQPYKYRHRKESSLLATGLNDGQIKVWEVETGNLLFNLVGHQDVVRDLSFAPGHRSSILVSASRDKTLRIWDLGQNVKQLKVLSGHSQWVYSCSISPDGQMLCSVAGEKSALLWSMRSYRLLRKLEGHQSCIASCDFSPDSALLATASYDTCVILWDPCTGEKLRSLWHHPLQPAVDQSGNFHTSSLRSVCFSPEGLYLATVADDRLLRIWALELESPVAFAPVKNGLCCTYFPHGGIIATGTRDGHAQFWTAPQALSSLKHLCRKVLRGCFTSYQVQALSIPKKMKEFLTYRTL